MYIPPPCDRISTPSWKIFLPSYKNLKMEEIISSIEEKIAGDIGKGGGSVNYSWEEILSLIEEKVAGARRSTPSWKIFSPS